MKDTQPRPPGHYTKRIPQADAQIAKNNITRQLRGFLLNGEPISPELLLHSLNEIEGFTGTGNYPSVSEIMGDTDK